MKAMPRLRIEPQPSRVLGWALPTAGCLTAGLVASLPLPPLVCAALLLAIALAGMRAARATLGRGLPAIVHVGADRRLTATLRDGRSIDGAIAGSSCVWARGATIVWRAAGDGGGGPRRCRTLLILPDMLPAEDFRRLRVLLRYGRAPPTVSTGATSGAAAARPASQAAAS